MFDTACLLHLPVILVVCCLIQRIVVSCTGIDAQLIIDAPVVEVMEWRDQGFGDDVV